ncbi:hypothetical protein BT69DRAFT_1275349 [Atractiella rhizophila]|nr:hypothetical protein BT69DRAFT_1275349 [Atractiella rhizophila]
MDSNFPEYDLWIPFQRKQPMFHTQFIAFAANADHFSKNGMMGIGCHDKQAGEEVHGFAEDGETIRRQLYEFAMTKGGLDRKKKESRRRCYHLKESDAAEVGETKKVCCLFFCVFYVFSSESEILA